MCGWSTILIATIEYEELGSFVGITYNAPALFRNLQKKVSSVQGACHCPNTLPTMVQGQDLRVVT